MIRLDKLIIGYREALIRTAISIKIEEGSLTAVVGANGTGKSTLLKTLCGLIPAISGKYHYKVRSMSNVAWLPQKSNVDRDFPISVYEVVSMGCWPKRSIFRRLSHKDIKNIDWALGQVGMLELKNVAINLLSGGQFQRMLFARLLVQDAPVMLMDEPFSGIDEDTQQLLMKLINKLHQQGKTIVAVLHDMSMVKENFTYILKIQGESVSFNQNIQSV